MIQTTLINYFNCNNEVIKKVKNKINSTLFKQAKVSDYFPKKLPKNQKTIIDYFKNGKLIKKEKIKKEENPNFELVLVKIEDAFYGRITCVKKNMYDPSLKYIAISYRWGELEEQLAKTPDYTAHITSFDRNDLIRLCYYIQREPDLETIPYLWIDAISVNQENHERKKETIRQMSSIYKRANYIVAIPDLNFKYLMISPANEYFILLTYKYSEQIYKSFFLPDDRLKYIDQDEEKNLDLVYTFLQYLLEAWADRAWVVSEYNLAKEKKEETGIPLKLMFITLLPESKNAGYFNSFISYDFNSSPSLSTYSYGSQSLYLKYKNRFMAFLQERLSQRVFLDKLLNTRATKNEDRFYAILPSWKNYHIVVKNKNTISDWNLTTLMSIRLKLFAIMDDLWDKARLLHACSKSKYPTLPSFASDYHNESIFIKELDDPVLPHRLCTTQILNYILKMNGNKTGDDEYKNVKKMTTGSLLMENLTSIKLNGDYLSVKANNYFIIDQVIKTEDLVSTFSFKMTDQLKFAYIPYFICSLPKYKHIMTLYKTSIYLLGDMEKNRWVIYGLRFPNADNPILCSADYTFKIY